MLSSWYISILFFPLIQFNYICSQIKQANIKGTKILTQLGLWNFQDLSPTYSFFSTVAKQNLVVNLPIAGTKRGLPGGSMVKNPPANAWDAGDTGLIPGSGKSPGRGNGNPLQYSCLENPHGQRNPGSYSPYGCKELDMTEATQHKQRSLQRLVS